MAPGLPVPGSKAIMRSNMPKSPHPAPSTSRRIRLTISLCLLVGLGPSTVDLYLSALPSLQADFNTTASTAQLTLTATTVGFALGQLIVGQLSDTFGRRRPLLLATALHVAASIGVAAATDISWLLLFRVLQGMGAAGSGVVAVAMVRDLFQGSAFVRVLSRLALIGGLAPILAPVLGAQLVVLVSWRGLFLVVAAYGLLVLAVTTFVLTETLPVHRRVPSIRGLGGRYRKILGDRTFVGVALIGGLIVSAVFAYMSSSSFVLQRTYGLTPQGYSITFVVNAIFFVVGTQSAAIALRRLQPGTLLRITLPALAVAGFSVVLVERLGWGVVGVAAASAVFMLCAGSSVPALQVIGLSRHKETAGTSAALLGAANYGLAGIASPIVGAIGISSVTPLGVVMGITGMCATAALLLLVRFRAPSVLSANADHDSPAVHAALTL